MKSIKIDEEFDSSILNIALDTIKMGKQALVFVNTKKSAEKTAEEISKTLENQRRRESKILGLSETKSRQFSGHQNREKRSFSGPENSKRIFLESKGFFSEVKSGNEILDKLSDDALNSLSRPTKQCERLAYCLKKGIAFHHSGLVHKQKNIIEDNFRNGNVKIICCTPTLAYGVDLPAYRVILKDLKRYTMHGLSWIPVLDYMQMSGRAGRPNYDNEGQSIAVASTNAEKEKIEEKYLNGTPEDIYSKLAVEPVLRTYVLSLIASNLVTTKKQLLEFFDRTFYAYQFKDLRRLHSTINKVIDLLDEWEFIMRSSDEFSSANELEDEKYKTTLIGKRVAELYIDPLTANFIIACIRNASDKKIDAFSFLQMISHTLEIRPLLRVGMREYDKIQESLLELGSFLLENEPSMYEPEYEDFLNSVKTALMLNNWTNEYDEEFLLEQYNIRPGELRAKLEIADWLLYSAEEISKIMHYQSLIKEIIKLRLRLKYGVKEELLPLVRLENIGRVRARILFRNRIKDIKDLKSTDLSTLTKLLGEKTALSVKKQLNQELKEVPENKRKGQISLRDWGD